MKSNIKSEAEMLAFGRQLSENLNAGDWVAIDGPLGAGKTVLCKGILEGLGYAGEVSSPSYALVHHYEQPDVRIETHHADLYRVENISELEELGLEDDRDYCITLIEWAKRSGDYFGAASHMIEIQSMDDGSRQIELRYNNE